MEPAWRRLVTKRATRAGDVHEDPTSNHLNRKTVTTMHWMLARRTTTLAAFCVSSSLSAIRLLIVY